MIKKQFKAYLEIMKIKLPLKGRNIHGNKEIFAEFKFEVLGVNHEIKFPRKFLPLR